MVGSIEPLEEGECEFVIQIRGGSIPTEFLLARDKGFQSTLDIMCRAHYSTGMLNGTLHGPNRNGAPI